MSEKISTKLRLNFNERSDYTSSIDEEYPFDGKLWQYPERQPLEKQIADYYQLMPSQILCTNGGDEAIMILMRILMESKKSEQRQLILPLPAFSQYLWGMESWHLDAQLIASNADLSIDIESTLTCIEKVDSSVVVITRPNNPTGELIDIEKLIALIETAAENNSWVFLDEAYIEFSEQPSVAKTLLQRFDNLVVLRTLSKAYGLAGIRLGYILGSEKLIAEFSSRCAPFNIALPTLKIASRALAKDNLADVNNYCQRIIKNRQQLFDGLISNNIPVLPSQANYLLLPLPTLQSTAIASFLAKNDIMVRCFDSVELSHCLRITIPYHLEKLQQLLQQVLMPDLICLDMDGVLIDTSGSYDATVVATVKQLSGLDVGLAEIEQLKTSGGFNNDWLVAQTLLQQVGVNVEIDTVIDVFQKLYLGDNNDGLVSNEVPIINRSLATMIRTSTTTAFAIVTGRPLQEAKAGAELVGLNTLDLISLDCVEHAKPSPEGIVRLQEKYSTLSWMCGDNPDDMQAAVTSNSLAIGIRRSKDCSEQDEALHQAGADIVLNDINELENWLCPLK